MLGSAGRFSTCSGACHATTLFRTAAAGFCAPATVLHVLVPLAFLGAFLTRVRAQLAQLGSPFAAASHEDGGRAAKFGAFEVEPDATGQHLDVLFVQAGNGTVFALDRAFIAGVDAAAHGFRCHGFGLLGSKWGKVLHERSNSRAMWYVPQTRRQESDRSIQRFRNVLRGGRQALLSL
jgi:hypothetical protein